MRTQIWSSGGGVQSSAIAALLCMGEMERPDLAIIVDTEREMSTTWEYLEAHVLPALKKASINLVRVKKTQYATVDLYSKNKDILIPVFTETGKLPTFCSNEWKQRVMRRWATEQGVKQAEVWIGFTVDELRRVKQPLGKWRNRYPLIEKRMSRSDCLATVKKIGWPTPPRSSCWMCPNKTMREWREMEGTGDFQKAIDFEKKIRVLDDELLLSNTGKTLDEADLKARHEDLFTGLCDNGMCFV